MKYLLVNPPLYDVSPVLGISQPAHLLRIGSYLKSQGHRVELFDYEAIRRDGSDTAESLATAMYINTNTGIDKKYGDTDEIISLDRYGKSNDEFKQYLTTIDKPDKIYITSVMTFHYRGVHEVASLCKEIYPDVEVTIGGIYASLCTEHAKTSRADKIFVGEIPEANISKPDIGLLGYVPDYVILKSRWGCPFKCSYCAVHKLEGRKVRSIPPDIVFRYMEELHKDFGIRVFCFWDSNILIDWDRHLGQILKMVRKSKLDIELDFTYGFQPNMITRDICQQMRESNVRDLFSLPIESADEQITATRFHRSSTVSDLKNAVNMLYDVGYTNISFYVLAGMPEQPIKTVLKSCALAWELGGRPIVLYFTPIPGTEEYEKYKDLIQGKDLEDLQPMLFPFCRDKKQLRQYFQVFDYHRLSLDEALELPETGLHVDMIQMLKERRVIEQVPAMS